MNNLIEAMKHSIGYQIVELEETGFFGQDFIKTIKMSQLDAMTIHLKFMIHPPCFIR
jgi:hypothetical protein